MLALAQATGSLPLTTETLIPLGAAVTCTIAVLTGMVVVVSKANALLFRIDQIEKRVRRSWTMSHQRIWELEFKLANLDKGIQVPDSLTVRQRVRDDTLDQNDDDMAEE